MRTIELKKLFKIAAAVIFAGFIVAQFFRPNRENPPIAQSETLQAATKVPADVQAILTRSCSNCHSNETSYPWYSNISPFSWFLSGHIEDGRRELNISIWNTYSPSKKSKKLEEICEQVEAGTMPLPSYLWIHRNAALIDSEPKLLCDWTAAEKALITAGN